MKSFLMTVSKKENGEYKEVGKVTVFYPLLADLNISAEVEKDDEEGFPLYKDEKAQYAFDAVLASVKAAARNKLVSGTATLKSGCKIAETVAELLESGSGRNGEGLANRREALAAYAKYVASLGKSEAFVKGAVSLVSSAETLRNAEAKKREKTAEMLASFAETLNAEQAAKFSNTLTTLAEACEGVDAADWD